MSSGPSSRLARRVACEKEYLNLVVLNHPPWEVETDECKNGGRDDGVAQDHSVDITFHLKNCTEWIFS